MSKRCVGIVKEGKVPPDFRVPLTPHQCVEVMEKFPHITVKVESSPIRKFKDEEYEALGIQVVQDLSDCDILMGVKEVPISMLLEGKTYLFFSHTLKKQPHNAKLMRALLDKKIRLIDYEAIKNEQGKRLIGFGRYAGIVGTYQGWRTFGLKHDLYSILSPSQCDDRKAMEEEMKKIVIPQNTKVVVTGFGRVGNGAKEIMDLLPIKLVSAEAFLTQTFSEPVYVHLDTHEYYERIEGGGFDKKEFYANPEKYHSILPKYVAGADMYIACHLWAGTNPVLITKEDVAADNWKCMVLADVSCDTNGPIAPTIKASKIADPIFGYDRHDHVEVDYKNEQAIAVMSIDNLPCELPKDASEDFGNELIKNVFPDLFTDLMLPSIWKATETTEEGKLTPHFEYLKEYAESAH